MKNLKNFNVEELNSSEIKTVNGGDGGASAVALAILAMAIYEHGKSFLAGMFNPFTSNE